MRRSASSRWPPLCAEGQLTGVLRQYRIAQQGSRVAGRWVSWMGVGASAATLGALKNTGGQALGGCGTDWNQWRPAEEGWNAGGANS